MGPIELVANGGVGRSGLNVGSAANLGQRRQANTTTQLDQDKVNNEGCNLRFESTSKVKSSDDGLKLGEACNSCKVGVVGNQEPAADGGQAGEGEVGQVGAVNKGQSTAGLGQVGGRKALETVGIEANGSSNGSQRGHVDPAYVAESQIGSILQVGE